jgi:SAM-dependent methyltransferase
MASRQFRECCMVWKIGFEKKYYKESHYWGLKPDSCVVRLLRYKKGGSVLYIGAGEGRNGVLLAKRGSTVTAISHSKSAIRKCREFAGGIAGESQYSSCRHNSN